jgi:hypothetical protein
LEKIEQSSSQDIRNSNKISTGSILSALIKEENSEPIIENKTQK